MFKQPTVTLKFISDETRDGERIAIDGPTFHFRSLRQAQSFARATKSRWRDRDWMTQIRKEFKGLVQMSRSANEHDNPDAVKAATPDCRPHDASFRGQLFVVTRYRAHDGHRVATTAFVAELSSREPWPGARPTNVAGSASDLRRAA